MWPNLSNNFTKNASVVGAAARVAAAGSLRAIFARFRPVWADRLAFSVLQSVHAAKKTAPDVAQAAAGCEKCLFRVFSPRKGARNVA